MKQKKLNNILYVFDVNPYEITQDTDAEVIKVQEESYKGFVEMNQSLAEKIVKYNYHTMCVNVPEWAPYVEQEDPQGSLTFGVYGENAALYIAKIERTNSDNEVIESWEAGVDLTFPFQCNVNDGDACAIEFVDDVDPSELYIIGGEYINIRWQDQETGHWWASTGGMHASISVGFNSYEPSLTFSVDGTEADADIVAIERTNSDNEVIERWEAGNDLSFPFQCNVNVTDQCAIEFGNGISPYDINFINGESMYIRWQDQETGHWWASTGQMSESISVSINAASPSTYTITLDAQNLSDQNIEVKLNDNQVTLTGEYVCQNNDTLTFWPLANPSDYIASNMDGFDDTPGQEHWWKTVNSSETIGLTHLGAGVNFVASWGESGVENVSEVVVCGHPATGNDLTDPDWTETVRAYPGTSQVQYFVSTGLPTDMEYIEVDFVYGNDEKEWHFAYKQTDPDTGEVFYSDATDDQGTSVTNPGIWQYNNTPDSGLPYITFTLPSADKDGNAFADNTDIIIIAKVQGS